MSPLRSSSRVDFLFFGGAEILTSSAKCIDKTNVVRFVSSRVLEAQRESDRHNHIPITAASPFVESLVLVRRTSG